MQNNNEFSYDETENIIHAYNGLRRYYLPGKGYRYIDGNSIACAIVTSYILRIMKRGNYLLSTTNIIGEIIKLYNGEEFHDKAFHKVKEKILLYPLSSRNVNSIKKLKKFCNIVGFLDFRKFINNTILIDNENFEYPIYNSIRKVNEGIDYIYIDEIIEDKINNKKTIYSRLIEIALEKNINLSFYDKPDRELIKKYQNRLDVNNIKIEFVNILSER